MIQALKIIRTTFIWIFRFTLVPLSDLFLFNFFLNDFPFWFTGSIGRMRSLNLGQIAQNRNNYRWKDTCAMHTYPFCDKDKSFAIFITIVIMGDTIRTKKRSIPIQAQRLEQGMNEPTKANVYLSPDISILFHHTLILTTLIFLALLKKLVYSYWLLFYWSFGKSFEPWCHN